ncbi:MAG: DUF4347 domain-containing protein [Desulfomonile tiedjei]|nr:DUF4347 domain-containing protein [Desulfomonile tiedjei]
MGRWLDRNARYYHPELIFEQLEERIVLDASLDLSSLDTHHDLNVIVASSTFSDVRVLADAAAGKAQLVLYDQHDNLAAIEAKLEELTRETGRKIGLVAVVAHGSPGELVVGNEQIDLSTVDAHHPDLQALADNLGDQAQIQLYGCSVAENPAGKALVDRIAAYTGADVFASTDATGGKAGNWSLEYASREAATPVAIFDAAALGNVGPLADPESLAPLSSDLYDSTLNKAFVEFNGEIYFSGSDSTSGMELRAYNPLTGITRLVTDIIPGPDSGGPLELSVMNGALYFVASDSPSAGGLWRTDGTDLGTELLAEFSKPGGLSALPFANLTAVNNVLFFSANDEVHGWELWKSDGTAAQTVMVEDLWPGADSGNPTVLTNGNGTLFFRAPSVDGYLWRSDGTAADTFPVRTDVLVRTDSLDPTDWDTFAVLNGEVYFTGEDTGGLYGRELWKSNGTTAGTVMVKDIQTGAGSGSPHYLTPVNGSLYFAANDGVNGEELWRSDGTTTGTALVENIGPGSQGNYPFNLTDVNGALLFISYDNALGDTLWRSDGTPGGTFMVADPSPVHYWTWWVQMMNVGGTANFVMDDAVHGIELWQTDGTAGGTSMVQDIWPGSSSASPIHMTNVNGTLYFFAQSSGLGYEPWRYVPGTTPNQPPVAGNFALNGAQGVAVPVDGWNFTDPDGDPAQSITVTNLPDRGTLFRDANTNNAIDAGEAVALNQVITWADASTSHLVKYVSTGAYIGPDAVQYLVTDTRGAIGTVAGTGSITVSDTVNDPPVNHFPPNQTILEDIVLVFSPGNGNAISISDSDAGTAVVQMQLSSANGTLTLAQTTGLAFSAGDGTSDSSVTFSGTIDAINTALNGMRFVPSPNYNGLGGGVTVFTNDLGHTGADGAKFDTDTLLVTVSAVQDPPVAGDFALYADAGTVVSLDGWTFTDPDGDQAQSITLTVLPQHGTLFRDANANNVIDAGEAVTLNQVISWADAETTPLVKYQSVAGYNGPDTVRYVVTDTAGTVGTVAGTVGIDVGDPVNDPPVNQVPSAQSTVQNAPLILSTGNGNALSISDPDAGTAPVQVRLTGANGTLSLAQTTGLTFSAGDGTADATMTFVGATDAINEALNGMTFTPVLNYSGSAANLIIFTDDLGNTGADGPKSDSDTVAVTVVSDPNLPMAGNLTVAVMSSTPTWPSVGWITGWNYTDAQNDAPGFVRIESLPTRGTLFLDANGDNLFDAGEGITAGQEIPWSQVNSFQGVKYLGQVGYDGVDSFHYVVIDASGAVGTFQGTGTIGVGPNDPPVHTLPGAQTVPEDSVLVFSTANANQISVADPDVGTSPLEVTLYSYYGKVTLGSTSGVTLLSGDGVDDWVVTFRGSIDAVNTVLDGLRFTPQANYAGYAAVSIVTSDLGASGAGSVRADADNIPITITSVSDLPVAQGFSVTVYEDIVGTIAGWAATDGDGEWPQAITITSLPAHGTLFVDANDNNRVDSGEAVGLNQDISWIDAVMRAKAKYLGSLNYSGPDLVNYAVRDAGGSLGSGTETANITVAAVNDPPVNTIPGPQSTAMDTPLTFSTTRGNVVSVADPDVGTGQLQLQLSSMRGTISLASTGGLTFLAGDGTGDPFTVFTGNSTAVNTALNGMRFIPETGYNGAASIAVIANDLGNSGLGGPMLDVDTVSINVGNRVV